ncbi:hypothetical protein ABMA28_004136 [Loxostege sticticalis]|uniref:Uncharacterized protein n=1 Tax=Loxostege sticticalis TaxID=481309 RepID=A0ABD0SUE1_LOXSC
MSRHRVFITHFRNLKLQRNLSSRVRKVDEFTLTSYLPFQPVPRVNLFHRIWADLPLYKDQVALVSAETKKSYTFVQLQRYIANFGTSLLKKLHLQSNDIVAIAAPNCPEYPVATFGAIRAGCVVTLVNPAYKNYELVHQFTITKPKVVVTFSQAYPTIAKGLHDAKIEAKIIIIDNPTQSIPDGAVRYTEIAENGEADLPLLEKIEKGHDDLAIIPFSSGTTGLPKGVEITYKNLLASLDIMTHKDYVLSDVADGTEQDVVPFVLPFFHIYGLVITLMGHWSVGAKMVTMTGFSPQMFIRVLSSERVSLLYLVPPLVDFLAKHPLVTKKHFEHLKYIFVGGAPMSKAGAEAFLLKANPRTKFMQGFAVTETTCMGLVLPKDGSNKNYDSCGDPALNIEMRLCDPESGKPVAFGNLGEVCIRSPTVTRGYYKNEQATRESMTNDGFYKSGDLGVYKPGEGLYIVDRIKDLIKVKGMQVAPAELEAILRSHPSVSEAAVIGVPHKTFGEVPKAFVVVKQLTTEEELKDFVADQVVDYKRLHEVVIVDAIPKNATGKVLKKLLRDM